MARREDKSKAAFERAKQVLVGGVNSPVRAYGAVGGLPPFIAKASGEKLTDLDGNEYIDYVGTWGPAVLGHAHPKVVEAVCRAVRRGASFGAPTEAETLLAEKIAAALPSCQKVRFTSSGTEAVMTAVRLARGATGRNKIVKFVGGYHGHADALLVRAGSGATTLGTPSSPGVPPAATADTLLAPYNDAHATARLFSEYAADIAAVLVEPVAGNMGVIPPAEGFLRALREQCTRHGALLIFDEVMTGFRVALGGAQELYGVQPDLTTLGKIIGGGLPVGAVAGRAEIMDHLAPVGPVYQAGTLSGNPAAMAAGLATLDLLAQPGFYETLEKTSAALESALRQAAADAGLAERVCFQRVGSMMCCFFTPGPVRNYDDATACDLAAFNAYFHAMLQGGVYLAPSQFEAMFVSAAHTAEDVAATARVAQAAFRAAADAFGKA
ncbi:MAG: glutamate-1-semialdehyde 2,1-aminomutase [Phycisphaerae bacterium]|nr:glutamate-1-semialdehyde 2,1-aminomutase [Phycisphaerae bacterium]